MTALISYLLCFACLYLTSLLLALPIVCFISLLAFISNQARRDFPRARINRR